MNAGQNKQSPVSQALVSDEKITLILIINPVVTPSL